jgi:hypothetical protein
LDGLGLKAHESEQAIRIVHFDAVHDREVLISDPPRTAGLPNCSVAATPGSVCSVRKTLSSAPGVRSTATGATTSMATAASQRGDATFDANPALRASASSVFANPAGNDQVGDEREEAFRFGQCLDQPAGANMESPSASVSSRVIDLTRVRNERA